MYKRQGYLRGLLSAEKLGQDLGRAALTDSKNRKTVYGMTLITGHPFSPNGVVHNVVGALREGLVVVSNNKIPDLGKKSHATLAPLVRSKKDVYKRQPQNLKADSKPKGFRSSRSPPPSAKFPKGPIKMCIRDRVTKNSFTTNLQVLKMNFGGEGVYSF